VPKDLLFRTSLLTAFLVAMLAVGFLAPSPLNPSSPPLTDAPEYGAISISSPTPSLRDAPVLPSPADTVPQIESTYPMDEERDVPPNATIRVDFESPVEFKVLSVTITPQVEMTQTLDASGMTFFLEHATPFAPCTEYSVYIAGVAVGTGAMNPWTFTTFCGGSVAVRSPEGDEIWTGGSLHVVEWSMELNDGEPHDWTLDWLAGGTPARIASGTARSGPLSFDWRLPVANRTNVRVRACIVAGIRSTPLVCDTSGGFTVDSTAPALLTHSPPDGATDVPLSLSLTATFSEPMARAVTEAAFSIAPAAPVASRTWTTPNVLVVTLEGLRNATRYAWGFRCSAVDRSSPGNPLADCSAVHDFTTTVRGPDGGGGTHNGSRSTLPGVSLTLLSPVGQESWTGGSLHGVPIAIRNNATDPCDLTVSARYRCAGGTCAGTIGTLDVQVSAGSTVSLEIPWTLPRIDAPDVIVNATAENLTGIAWAEGGPIGIDSTPPRVVAAGPSGAHVRADPRVAVTFSESLVTSMSPAPITVTPDLSVALAWTPAYDGLAADLLGALPCTLYTVALGDVRDLSDPGNPLVPYSWTLTTECLPGAALLSPDGGEDWTGNTVHDVRWTVADADDASLTLTLSYSIDGGADGFPNVIADGLVVEVGSGTLRWALPPVDSERVLVRIRVSDPAGNVATDAGAAVFTIDSSPPRLLASFPGDGSATMWADRDIWFVFSERVDRASFASGFRLSPDPGGVTLSWSAEGDRDTLLVGHDPFDPHRLYAATFPVTAKDDSDPGNALGIAAAVRFVAILPPGSPPPVAFAVGQGRVNEGDPAAFDATGSTGDITWYDWTIADDEGRFIAVLVGPKATYTFPRAGQYTVTLTVTDANGATDADTIEIAVLPVADWLLFLLAAAGTAAAFGQAVSTERGRLRAFQLFLVPLYARRKKDDLLEHERRGMIRGYILVHPGDSYTDIKRNLGLSNGTLTFHLGLLEREGIIRSQTHGTRKVFYPEGANLPENGGNLHEVQLRILRAVRELPGIGIGDIAGALGISSQHALWHLRALVGRDLVRFERHRFRMRCYPGAAEVPEARATAPSAQSGATRAIGPARRRRPAALVQYLSR